MSGLDILLSVTVGMIETHPTLLLNKGTFLTIYGILNFTGKADWVNSRVLHLQIYIHSVTGLIAKWITRNEPIIYKTVSMCTGRTVPVRFVPQKTLFCQSE